MDISSASSALDANALGVAVQTQVLSQMKAQGASMLGLIASGTPLQGSVNSPSQGRFIDAVA